MCAIAGYANQYQFSQGLSMVPFLASRQKRNAVSDSERNVAASATHRVA